MEEKRANWSGQIAFVLAAAASAIGLGNLWRFPYLAAQYGGGAFIAVYLLLVATLGFTLMLTEVAIGRRTRQSQLTAYSILNKKWGFLGIIGTIIPLFILPYYCVIGGWVVYFFKTYLLMAFVGVEPMGAGAECSKAFFDSFITSSYASFAYAVFFIAGCAGVIVLGVKNGIEKSNIVMMPLLFLIAIAISVYVMLMPGSAAGLKYYLVPDLNSFKGADGGFSVALLAKTLLGAVGQMFYSLSLAMGIMITYGSYMRKADSIEKCVRRIEICDTFVALIAGLMIIPVVYLFAVKNGIPVETAMKEGPGLMFVTLPKVFASLGVAGAWIGMVFFLLVIFAAATSAISLFEACVASVCDLFKMARAKSTLIVASVLIFLASFSAFGYGVWGHVTIFGMQFLDFFDFSANSVMMPILAALTCVFAGWILKPKTIFEECEAAGAVMKAKRFYSFTVRFVAPVLMIALLVSETCRVLKLGGWSI